VLCGSRVGYSVYAMTGRSPLQRLGIVHVVAISVATYFVLDRLKMRPFGEVSGFGGLAVGVALLAGLIVYGIFCGWRTGREMDREALQEARRHGYESWAEYMAAQGDASVRDSWQVPALRERNRLSRRLRRLFSRRR